jgi:hypothetical protein
MIKRLFAPALACVLAIGLSAQNPAGERKKPAAGPIPPPLNQPGMMNPGPLPPNARKPIPPGVNAKGESDTKDREVRNRSTESKSKTKTGKKTKKS